MMAFEEKRAANLNGTFVEKLSMCLIRGSMAGAALILLDPTMAYTFADGTVFHLGGTGFSEQLKGAVISAILITGFAGVITYWLGASKQGDKAQDSVNSIAQAAGPAVAAAAVIQAQNANDNGQRSLTAEELAAKPKQP